MQEMVSAVKEYILETLGLQVETLPWATTGGLPVFIRDYYAFYAASIMDRPYFLVVARASEQTTPAQIAKHLELIEKMLERPCIYVAESLPAYNRQRLVSHRVRFVIPEIQMYLPDLGIDCHKTAFSKRMSPFQGLIPSAQAVVICALVQKFPDSIIPSELALKLHYARMTMTRALDELEKRNIGKTVRIGKERCFVFPQNKKKIWEQALNYMQSPVKEFIWICADDETLKKIRGLGYIAGLAALEQQSMLNAPPQLVFAISKEIWKALLESGNIRILPISEGANIQLEVWRYDPGLFAKNQVVDPFSLYLSLRKIDDERIEQALGELMEKIEW